jgi:hypothetical protein
VRPALVLHNDAGFGADRAGAAGLTVLNNARGVLSAVNEAAYRLGGRVGGSALALARCVAEKAV